MKEEKTLRPARRVAIVLDDRGVALRTPVSVAQAIAHAGPRLRFHRRHEAVRAGGGRPVRNPEEYRDTPVDEAAHPAGGGFDNRLGRGGGGSGRQRPADLIRLRSRDEPGGARRHPRHDPTAVRRSQPFASPVSVIVRLAVDTPPYQFNFPCRVIWREFHALLAPSRVPRLTM